ncbi:MAG TPA: M56 family metallopeptidase [Bryobacteraceae bacterium]|jgi:uncharacterized protein (TIGR03435 family)|nr:M56 family metallopeptidase [Bryobacteraceae bacterium]
MRLHDVIPANLFWPLANHLWQSTLFAVLIAMLAFALRNNGAQARFGLWFAASLKFLLPFSLLIAAGSHLQWTKTVPIAPHGISATVQQFSQPFNDPLLVATRGSATAANHAAGGWAIALAAIWGCGVLLVLMRWLRQWLVLSAAVRAGTPVPLSAPIRVVTTPCRLEPGVFGIVRPVLLLPSGIADHLAPAQLAAIVAHELCHVRRRDNLTAAFHMLIEAIFWFHPLVWWIGSRLLEERERACDEEVLRLGNQPRVYAESILKTCQFYLESPLACMSGVTGSDLKKRVVRIMSQSMAGRLNNGKKLLLAAAALASVCLPIVLGLSSAPRISAQTQGANGAAFETVSIKPSDAMGRNVMFGIRPGGWFSAKGVTLRMLVEEAYGVKDSQVSGLPDWADSDHYDVEGKPDESVSSTLSKLSPDENKVQMMRMLQAMLADRFQLSLGHETKELPVYVLQVGKNGPKFHEAANAPPAQSMPSEEGQMSEEGQIMTSAAPMQRRQGIFMAGRGNLTLSGADLKMFANVLSRMAGRVVIDKTGLTGKYDLNLQWTPEDGEGPMLRGGAPNGPAGTSNGPAGLGGTPDASGASLSTALQEQLGLTMESQKAPVDILVIQSVEKPSQN